MENQQHWFDTIRSFFEEQIAFDRYLGMKLTHIGPGEAHMQLPFRPEFLGDPFRPALHGGIAATVIDTVAGAAALSTLPFGSKCSTVDMRVDYLLPGLPQDVLAEARVIRKGSSVAVVDVQVFQSKEGGTHQVASGRVVYSLKPSMLA